MRRTRLCCGAVAVALVTAVGVSAQPAPPLQFEVASVKPAEAGAQQSFGVRPGGRFTAASIPLIELISLANQVYHGFQIVGAPAWVRGVSYAIEAKAPAGVTMGALATEPGTPRSPVQQMLAALLAERFGLRVHHETREMPAFALVMARADGTRGPSLKPSPSDIDCEARRAAHQLQRPAAPPSPGEVAPCLLLMYRGRLVVGTMPIEALVTFLTTQMDRTVVDRTGLTDRFDFDLTWAPDELAVASSAGDQGASAGAPAAGATGPSLVTAIQEQLGLKLQPTRASTDVLVIDSIAQPMPD